MAELLFSLYHWSSFWRWRDDVRCRLHDLQSGACFSRNAFVQLMVNKMIVQDYLRGSVLATCQRSAARIADTFWVECKTAELEPCEEHVMGKDGQHDVMLQGHPLYL